MFLGYTLLAAIALPSKILPGVSVLGRDGTALGISNPTGVRDSRGAL